MTKAGPAKSATVPARKPVKVESPGKGEAEAAVDEGMAAPAVTPLHVPPSKRKKGEPAFTGYQAAVRYLYERVNVERMNAKQVDPKMFKLDRMQALLEAMGNPQDAVKFVHVAGTNGKGSVCAMTTSALRGCGYTVGLYTSPHLVDLRERIQINGQMISHHAFTDLMGRAADAAATLNPKLGEPTFFELVTAVGLAHFADEAVDVAVIEVGLGGKLDSTNVITPEVAAVCSISLDHTQFLGKTPGEIARQKAGIFKKGVPALTFDQSAEVIEAMREVAAQVEAPFQVVGKDIEFSSRFEHNPLLGHHTRVGLTTARNLYEHVPVPLKGDHQAQNCGLVLAIIDKLSERGFDLPSSKVVLGLEQTSIPGRMELIWKQPKVLVDGAHNPAALSALSKNIGAHVTYDSLVMIFGCAADKDIDQMLHSVAATGDKVIFTKVKGNTRAALPQDLARRFADHTGKMCQVAETLEDALKLASRAAGRDDLILITGSFYLVGEAKKLFADRAGKDRSPAPVHR
ncbi:MAG: bifunctional folylpolyglutamate synthase/dihydrofolate synthase [Planctomycetes bacterium]|nr:bifunctional folylpolyglutamate synthase/dihydrofolate synthase [Planctomycetota bacterium]